MDPRSVVGDFIWSWMGYGFKGLRYVTSKAYRGQVHSFWRVHPGRRAGGIRRMIVGAVLDVFLIVCVALAVASHT